MVSPYSIVDTFEKTIAEYAGSKYAVAVDSCCNAIFLCCKYLGVRGVDIVKRTYPGVICSIKNSGGSIMNWLDNDWQGIYEINPYRIIDSALRFKKGMYIRDSYYCLSFHLKKHLFIGRAGMILTDSEEAYEWFKKARFDGRSEVPLKDDNIKMVGWNMYMTPEQAARGLMVFDLIKDKDLPDIDWRSQGYPDLSEIEAYKT